MDCSNWLKLFALLNLIWLFLIYRHILEGCEFNLWILIYLSFILLNLHNSMHFYYRWRNNYIIW